MRHTVRSSDADVELVSPLPLVRGGRLGDSGTPERALVVGDTLGVDTCITRRELGVPLHEQVEAVAGGSGVAVLGRFSHCRIPQLGPR